MAGMGHIHADPPQEFANLTNPFAGDTAAAEAGKETFNTNCATCHGPEGQGDGPASTGLDPQPANLADGMMMGGLSDGYLFWRITKGGAMEPFNSAMPAWEAALTEEQRWQLVSFIRSLSDDGG
jgi:mono/diheme cytochrome c family protein